MKAVIYEAFGALPQLKNVPDPTLGENATEIIHIGQTLLALDGTIEFLRDSVFNHPTFAEAYKVAALNGLNKL